jgi:hypothetical protein
MTTKLTAGQRKFLETVAEGERGNFHVRVTKPVMEAGLVFPLPGALFPWLVRCNGQMASDYYLTPEGVAFLEAEGWQFICVDLVDLRPANLLDAVRESRKAESAARFGTASRVREDALRWEA